MLRPEQQSERVWNLMNSGKRVAELHLDHFAQADELVLSPEVSENETIDALRLTASHAFRYLVSRYYTSGPLKVTRTSDYLPEVSESVLRDVGMPDIVRDMNKDNLSKALAETRIDVTYAQVNTLDEAVNTALSQIEAPLLYKVGPSNENLKEHIIGFGTLQPFEFVGWHSMFHPRDDLDLYIVPSYHPVMRGMNDRYLINGDTDALIGGRAIRSVYAPAGSREGNNGFAISSWDHVNHPYKAAGSVITVRASATKSLSAEGIDEIKSVVSSLLQLDNEYMAVSGGFRPEYTYPQNVADIFGITTSMWEGKARGSEGFCVWAYNVLKEEGQLQDAYIPKWFTAEGWKEAYERYSLAK